MVFIILTVSSSSFSGNFFFGAPRAPRLKKLNSKALLCPFLLANLLLSRVWDGQLICVLCIELSSAPSENGKPFTMPSFGLYQPPSHRRTSFAGIGVMMLWEGAVLSAHGPLNLAGLSFPTPGFSFPSCLFLIQTT